MKELYMLAIVLLGETAFAQDREWIGESKWTRWSRATGDWGGLRSALPGVELRGSYIADWSTVWRGGVRRHRGTYRSLTDVNMTLDLEQLVGAGGASVFLDAYSETGRDGSVDAGDIQAFSNIDNPNTAEIAELSYQQLLFDGRLRARIGKVDANNEFNFIAAGADFLHSSATLSPSIFFIPTYPDPAMSVNLFYRADSAFFSLGLYDGATAEGRPTGRRGPSTFFRDEKANSKFWIFESGYQWESGDLRGPGRLLLGLWHHTADFDRFAGGRESGTEGFYLQYEQRIWNEGRRAGDGDQQGVDVFAVYGRADGKVAAVEQHLTLGARYIGPIPGRDADAIGFLLSRADLSDEPSAGFLDDETAFELFYKIQVTGSFSVTPDIQFLDDPSGSGAIDDALVGSLRFVLTF